MAALIEEIRARTQFRGTKVWLPQGVAGDVMAVSETYPGIMDKATITVMLTFGYRLAMSLWTGSSKIDYYEKNMA